VFVFARRGGMLALVLLMIGVVLAPPTVARAAPTVSAVAAGLDGDITRLTLTFDQYVTHRVFTLANPHRVVVDLPTVRWRPAAGAAPKAEGLVNRVRHGNFTPDVFRVVVDCESEPKVVSSGVVRSPDGRTYRLVIELASARAGSRSLPQSAPQSAPPSAPSSVPQSADGNWTTAVPVAAATARPVAATSARPMGVDTIGQTLMPPPSPRPWTVEERTIVIDPGHGGKDPGATGVSGVYEKGITLATAREVRAELQKIGRYRVVLTRDSDVFIRLRDRVARARAAGADLFVSIHADALESPTVRGSSVYTLSETASDAEAAALADKENKVDTLAGVNLIGETTEVQEVLIDLTQRETMNQSARLARMVVGEIGKTSRLLPRNHRFAGFAVLKAPDVPSILIELGFLSNRADEAMLRQTSQQRTLARSIARAIDAYFADVQEARLY
jgi:N-acetylmuramoyl-L-alanine amidase